MNGRRVKEIRRQFRELNGREPRGPVSALVDDKSTFINESGVSQFSAAYEMHGELRFRKIMGVGVPSERRAIKRLVLGRE